MRFLVVVPTFNGKTRLSRCLQGLRNQTFGDAETAVIDNGSYDGTADMVRTGFPEVRLVTLPKNLGFAEAVNKGAKAAPHDWLMTLNDDAVPDADWLEQLAKAIGDNPGADMFACSIEFETPKGIIDSCGVTLSHSGTVMNLLCGERADPAKALRPAEVFGPCGAAAAYRRTLFRSLGGFDERFFAYGDDADLALRARLAGSSCMCVPTARVIHAHSRTLGPSSGSKDFLIARNRYLLLAKNFPDDWLKDHLPGIIGHSTAAFLGAVGMGHARGRLRALKGAASLYQQLRAEQKVAQRCWKVPFDHVARWFRDDEPALKVLERRKELAKNVVGPASEVPSGTSDA